MCLYDLLSRISSGKSPKIIKSPQRGVDVLLTGTFHSDNWIRPHLEPMAASKYCRRVRMVASDKMPLIDKVEAIYAPAFLTQILGKVPARLFIFAWVALKDRPDILGGFSMIPNGLIAALCARRISAKSMYICGGGPREVAGYLANPIFGLSGKHDKMIENYLHNALGRFDLIITMGTSAVKYFSQYADAAYHIMPGGYSTKTFYPTEDRPEYDLILIGRLTYIKRVDIFLESVRLAKERIPDISAIVVGGGPDLDMLRQKATDLEISRNVKFLGHQENVENWLRKSKVFVLTSDSEGLSQALIQAFLCGLPAVVSNVGDLGDLVHDGVNGFLVNGQKAEAYSDKYIEILSNEGCLNRLKREAFTSGEKFRMENVIRDWDSIFERVNSVS